LNKLIVKFKYFLLCSPLIYGKKTHLKKASESISDIPSSLDKKKKEERRKTKKKPRPRFISYDIY